MEGMLAVAGELSGLLVTGGILLAASAVTGYRKRKFEEEEEKEERARDASDPASPTLKSLKKSLLVDGIETNYTSDVRYVKLGFRSLFEGKDARDFELFIAALSREGVKVCGSEEGHVLCIQKTDVKDADVVTTFIRTALQKYAQPMAPATISALSPPKVSPVAAEDVPLRVKRTKGPPSVTSEASNSTNNAVPTTASKRRRVVRDTTV